MRSEREIYFERMTARAGGKELKSNAGCETRGSCAQLQECACARGTNSLRRFERQSSAEELSTIATISNSPISS